MARLEVFGYIAEKKINDFYKRLSRLTFAYCKLGQVLDCFLVRFKRVSYLQ